MLLADDYVGGLFEIGWLSGVQFPQASTHSSNVTSHLPCYL